MPKYRVIDQPWPPGAKTTHPPGSIVTVSEEVAKPHLGPRKQRLQRVAPDDEPAPAAKASPVAAASA